MQHKIRINDLARELEVKSKAILDVLIKVGITEKKTHSSSIEEDEAERVKKYFAEHEPSSSRSSRASSAASSDEFKPKIDLSHISKPGDVLKAITQKAAQPTAPARPATPPPAASPARPAATPPKPAPPRHCQHAARSPGRSAEACAAFHYAAIGSTSAGCHRYSSQASSAAHCPGTPSRGSGQADRSSGRRADACHQTRRNHGFGARSFGSRDTSNIGGRNDHRGSSGAWRANHSGSTTRSSRNTDASRRRTLALRHVRQRLHRAAAPPRRLIVPQTGPRPVYQAPVRPAAAMPPRPVMPERGKPIFQRPQRPGGPPATGGAPGTRPPMRPGERRGPHPTRSGAPGMRPGFGAGAPGWALRRLRPDSVPWDVRRVRDSVTFRVV